MSDMSESTTNGQIPPVMNEEQFLRFSQGAFDTLNATSLSRQSWFQRLLDPRRDYYAECGYPDADTVIDAWTYKRLYDREAIANRVVKVLPKESWQVSPKVYEDEDGDTATEFEDAWDALGSQLVSNGVSWYQDESGSAVWEYLARIDVLSGIGGYGILLLGLDDGKNLALPVDGVLESLPPTATEKPSARVGETNPDDKTQDDQYLGYLEGLGYGTGYPNDPNIGGTDQQYLGVQLGPTEKLSDKPSSKLRKLIFLRCYSEELVQIVRYEANVMSPRFGQPVMYRVTLTDPREIHGGLGLPMSTVNVHWSRVIHVADNLDVSEVWGVPRLRPVLNRIQDLIKLYGGSAEMYWKGAFPGISMETNPQLGGDVAVDVTKTRNELENLFNSLQRSIISSGMTAKVLSPTVVDPTPQINVQLEAICIQLGIPIRVFKGSERGELASSQDDASWNDRIRHRQNNYLTPRVVVPFIDRLILVGVLPEPNAASKKPSERVENFLRRAGYKVVERNAHGWLAYNKQGQLQQFRIGRKSGTGFPVINAANGKPVAVMAKGGYSVEWPDLDSLTDKDKAGIMLQRTQAYAAYVSGGIEAIIPPLEYMTKIDQMTEEEAESVIDTASKAHEDQETMTMPPQVDGRPVEAPPGTQDHADAETAKDQFSATLDAKKEAGALAPGGKPGTPKPVGKPPTANELDESWEDIRNANPDQPRDERGRFSHLASDSLVHLPTGSGGHYAELHEALESAAYQPYAKTDWQGIIKKAEAVTKNPTNDKEHGKAAAYARKVIVQARKAEDEVNAKIAQIKENKQVGARIERVSDDKWTYLRGYKEGDSVDKLKSELIQFPEGGKHSQKDLKTLASMASEVTKIKPKTDQERSWVSYAKRVEKVVRSGIKE